MPETKTINSPVINLIDESFDPKKSNAYHLSVLVSGNKITSCVLDTNTNKYLVLQSSRSLGELLTALPSIKDLKWASVTCAVANNKFTLVPSSLFDEDNKKSLLEFNHRIESEEKIHS